MGKIAQTIIEKIKSCIMYISFQERRARALEQYKKQIGHFRRMERDELKYEYIQTKTEYEHKKSIFLAFVVSILISLLLSFWGKFGELIGEIVQYLALQQNASTAVAEVSFIICIILIFFLTLIVFLLLVLHIKNLKQLYGKILMLEEIRKEKNIL